jgi:hypothetical protein
MFNHFNNESYTLLMKCTSINAQEFNSQLLESFSNLYFSELRIHILFIV